MVAALGIPTEPGAPPTLGRGQPQSLMATHTLLRLGFFFAMSRSGYLWDGGGARKQRQQTNKTTTKEHHIRENSLNLGHCLQAAANRSRRNNRHTTVRKWK